ncbi:MAG: hypothetical protein HN350_03165 [Phycisphaerales bacterium]|jgi:hypothetical protein|nr:hypothetical protein [Phycisphaerales bacterium]
MTYGKATVWTILTILLGMSQIHCSGRDDGPIRDEEASNGVEPRVSLTVKYPIGKYEMIQDQDMTTKGTVKAGSKKQKMNTTQQMKQWMDVDVTPDSDGKVLITMGFNRIRQETTGGPMGGVIDTDDSASIARNPAGKVLRAMKGAKITMKCDTDGKVTDVQGMNDLWDRVAREDPQLAPMIGQFKNTIGDKQMGEIIGRSQEYMPSEPVGVGAVWYAQFTMPIPMAGDMECEAKCKLISLTPSASGQIATIKMRARVLSQGAKSTSMGPASIKVKSMDLIMNGTMEINADTGLLMKQSIDLDGAMSMTISAQGNNVEMDATIIGTQEATVKEIK